MYMLDLSKIKGFEWDQGNIGKSYRKHGVTPNEAEEVFADKDLQVEPDIKHQGTEKRYIGIGQKTEGRIMLAVFTIRKNRIRIISTRVANKRERRKYEEAVKNNSKV